MSVNRAAFPITPEVWATHPDFHGMSLRDWFAGQALAIAFTDGAFDAEGYFIDDEAKRHVIQAARAYRVADAMLAERAKGGDA